MSSLQGMAILFFVSIYANLESIESSSIADRPYFSPVPATPSYLPVPGPDYSYPAIPVSPSYLPVEGPDYYSPEPEPVLHPPTPLRSSRGIKAAYWPAFDEFPASSIKTIYFTHLYYAFLLPEPSTFKLNVSSSDQQKMLEFTESLRPHYPKVKTLLSIGGGGNDPSVFSKMASNKSTRAIFIDSTIEVARQYGFNGVDLDWEFPANAQDMSNLALLYKQWRAAIVREAKYSGNKRLLLTSAVYFSSNFSSYGEPRSYPSESISKYVDWVSPMCFDYHGAWENFTGLHSALYDSESDISTSYGIGSWLKSGVPSRKLVMGLPLYGHTWKLKDPNVNGVGALAVGVGPGNGDGTMDYNEIVAFNSNSGSRVIYDAKAVSYYSYAGDSWLGYDDVRSVNLKVQFAKSQGLGGYFFWALGKDKDWSLSRQASKTWRH